MLSPVWGRKKYVWDPGYLLGFLWVLTYPIPMVNGKVQSLQPEKYKLTGTSHSSGLRVWVLPQGQPPRLPEQRVRGI